MNLLDLICSAQTKKLLSILFVHWLWLFGWISNGKENWVLVIQTMGTAGYNSLNWGSKFPSSDIPVTKPHIYTISWLYIVKRGEENSFHTGVFCALQQALTWVIKIRVLGFEILSDNQKESISFDWALLLIICGGLNENCSHNILH